MQLTLESLVSLLVGLGVGGILLQLLKAYLERQDRHEAGDASVAIKEIEDRADITNRLWKRLEDVEARSAEQQAEIDKWREMYLECSREIVQLKAEIERLKLHLCEGCDRAKGGVR